MINLILLLLDKPPAVFVNAETSEILNGPPPTVSAIRSTVRDQAASLEIEAGPSHVIVDLAHSPYALGQDGAQSAMIALCGVLLEYPFSYVIEAHSGSALAGVSLVVLELLLQRPGQLWVQPVKLSSQLPSSLNANASRPQAVLKFSVPQTAVDTLGQAAFSAILDRSLQTFQSRLAAGGKPGTLQWSSKSIVLDRVAL